KFPRLVVVQDGETLYLAEGFHRAAACKKAGINEVQVEIYKGTRNDAVLHAAGSNVTHGLRRSREDKRRAVSRLLADEEWSGWSDRFIAHMCRVSDKLVASMRNSGCGNPHPDSRKYP